MAKLNFHRGLRKFCAVIIGVVFFLSGSLKIMDPVGTNLIVSEYLKFLHLNFLADISSSLGFAIAIVEVVTGMLMVFGIWRRFTTVLVSGVVAGFTIITAFLLIFNPEMDCGCFGEAYHMTHMQSFLKNIILCILTAIVIFPIDNPGTPRKRRYIGFALVFAMVCAFSIYSQRNIPLIDFTEFKQGTELLAAQDNAAFKEEEGIDFSQESVSVLSFSDAFGEYQDRLAAEGNVMIASVYEPEHMTEKAWGQVSASLQNAQMAGMMPLLLCSSFDYVPIELSEYIFFADYKTLLTFNRSNGGLTFLSDGLIIRKWGWRNAPSADELNGMLNREPIELMLSDSAHRHLAFQGYILASFALMLFL